jgi:predicted esterase
LLPDPPPDLGFIHVYQPPGQGDGRTLLLLHGTGGNEHDLLPVGQMIAPTAGILSPRGQVLEAGMPRFFRRLAEGVFDVRDLKARTAQLADFVVRAATRYGFARESVVAAGFSNGANIAASLLLLWPETISAAILFRAVVPLEPEPLPPLRGRRVLISNGRQDPLVPVHETERLAGLFRAAGADVSVGWQPGGHALTPNDLALAARWLEQSAGREMR